METEINKLKELYLTTRTPEYLDANGVKDLMERIQTVKTGSHFYFSKYAVVISVILIVLMGVLGIAIAEAKPASTFYSVRQFAQKVAIAAENLTPHSVGNSVKTILQHTQVPTTTPTLTPSPTSTPGQKLEKHEERSKNTQHEIQQEDKNGNIILPTQTITPHHEDVQGVSTSKSEDNNSTKDGNTNKSSEANSNKQGTSSDNGASSNSNKENNGSSEHENSGKKNN